MSHEPTGAGGTFWGRSLVSVEWRKLCFVTYAVDPAVLAARVPTGLSLELLDQQALVCLALWTAVYPQVFGVALPSQPTSTEVALRYLVREGPRRGSVTVFEDSSSPFAALAARALFREPTRHTRLSAEVREQGEDIVCSYEVEREGVHRVRVRAAASPQPTPPQSPRYIMVQRPYGYATSSRGELLRYDLDHPLWDTYEVLEHDVQVDYGALYDPAWAFLSDARPLSVTLAEGSAVRASLPE